jgi:hypothetical protein
VSWVSTPFTTWSVLIALLSIHLATNYAAVKAVSMRCLNRQRANIVFSSLLQHGLVLSPTDVSQRERIFERDGVLRWADDTVLGSCRIGVHLEMLLNHLGRRHTRTGSLDMHAIKLPDLMDIFVNEAYILWFADCNYEAIVVLKEGCTPLDQLKAWAHALLLAREVQGHVVKNKPDRDDTSLAQGRLVTMRRTLEAASELFRSNAATLEQKGWDLDIAALETRAGIRAQIVLPNSSRADMCK